MAIVGTVAAVAGAGAAVYGAVQSSKAQKESLALQQQQQAAQTRMSRRQAIRRSQLARSQALAAAQSAGGLGGSGAAGGIGSLSSQLGADLGYSSQMGQLSGLITQANMKAANAAAFSDIGGSLFSIGAQLGGLDPFKPNQAQTNTSLLPTG